MHGDCQGFLPTLLTRCRFSPRNGPLVTAQRLEWLQQAPSCLLHFTVVTHAQRIQLLWSKPCLIP